MSMTCHIDVQADEALVMQSSVLYNKNPTLHLVITLFHTALQKEIEVFCMQVKVFLLSHLHELIFWET